MESLHPDPQNQINALSARIGRLERRSTNTVADALKLLSDLFSETVHDNWTKEEVVKVLDDFARLHCPDSPPHGGRK